MDPIRRLSGVTAGCLRVGVLRPERLHPDHNRRGPGVRHPYGAFAEITRASQLRIHLGGRVCLPVGGFGSDSPSLGARSAGVEGGGEKFSDGEILKTTTVGPL